MLVYIAAPYGAPTAEERELNIRRAIHLGRLALLCGHTPIVPHVLGRALFGDEEGEGAEEIRQRALDYCTELVSELPGDSALWVLRKQNGEISDGCKAEILAFTGDLDWGLYDKEEHRKRGVTIRLAPFWEMEVLLTRNGLSQIEASEWINHWRSLFTQAVP